MIATWPSAQPSTISARSIAAAESMCTLAHCLSARASALSAGSSIITVESTREAVFMTAKDMFYTAEARKLMLAGATHWRTSSK